MKQIEKAKDKYFRLAEELHLNTSCIMSTSEFLYLQEYLLCSQPIAMALDILQGEESAFFGIAIPTLIAFRRKLQKLTEQHWSNCKTLAENYLASINTRFSDYFSLASKQAQNTAIAAVSHTFKNRWFNSIKESQQNTILQLFKSAVATHSSHECEASTSQSNLGRFFDFGEENINLTVAASSSEREVLRFLADIHRC